MGLCTLTVSVEDGGHAYNGSGWMSVTQLCYALFKYHYEHHARPHDLSLVLSFWRKRLL